MVTVLLLRADRSERVAAGGEARLPATVFSSSTTEPAPTAVAGLGPSFSVDDQLRPTGDAGQSKVWFHDGRWWGILLADGEFRVHAFDPATGWADTGTLVDPRPTSHADIVTDGPTVFVASAGRSASAANAVEVRRYTYDVDDRLYRADREFPVRINTTGAEHVTIARTGGGTLWVAYVTNQRLEVAHTTGDDRSWSDPAPVPVPEASQPIDAAAVAAQGERVAVLAASVSGAVHAFTAADGETWTSTTVLAGAAVDVARVISLRSGPDDGPAFVGVTEIAPPADGEGNALAPHLVALASADGEEWSTHAVSRVEDGLSDPTIVVDEGDRSVVVLATSEGSVRSKRAPLDRLVFPSGRGVPVLPADVGGLFRNPTSARSVPAGAGLLVLAADSGIGRYGHAAVDVPAVGGAAGTSADAVLLADSFDGRPDGAGPPPGWQLSSEVGSGELDLVEGVDGSALRLRGASVGAARACRRFVSARPEPIRLVESFRVAGGGTGDAVVASLRGVGETASIRVDDRGRVAWFDGDTKRTGTASVAPATWYRLEVKVDPVARRYDFTVTGPNGSNIARGDGLRWRTSDARTPDQLCVGTREGTGAEIALDGVEVSR